MKRSRKSKALMALGVGIVAGALLLGASGTAMAQTWQPPEGSDVVKVKVIKKKKHKHHRKVVTKITYRTYDYWTPSHADLIGSVECKSDAQLIVESDWYLSEGEPMRDATQYMTGTCRTTWVFVPGLQNVSIGFEWKTNWVQTMDIDSVGVWYVPWEVEGIQTLPQIPIPTTHTKRIVKTVKR